MADPWQEITARFRPAYEQARDHVLRAYRPILEVREDGVLALLTRDGERTARWDPPQLVDDLKMLSHVPLLVYLVAVYGDEDLSELEELADRLNSLGDGLGDRDLTDDQRERNVYLVSASADFAREAARSSRRDRDSYAAFIAKRRQAIDENLADAAAANLEALDAAVRNLLQGLGAEEAAELVFVNHGNKSARIGNQFDRYVERLIGREEARRRLVFAEGADDVTEARLVLGEYLLDRRIGEDFFGDPYTMRTDILSSPSEEVLDVWDAKGRFEYFPPA